VLSQVIREAAANFGNSIVFHTDAVQAAGWETLDVDLLGVDLLSLSGHKFHGPKGVGIMYVRRGTPLVPLLAGGGQESDRRSGTENVPGIVGIATALSLAESEREEFANTIRPWRDDLIEGILERIEGAHLNGHRGRRLANNVNISFDGIEGEPLLISLDLAGIYASSASACSSASVEPSHVLLALGMDPERAMASLRLSLGRENSKEDVSYVLDVLPRVVAELRAMPTLAST
jgi:cysteine desulfurase